MIRLVLAVVAGLLVLPDFARGDITVDTTTDGNDGECVIDCTLREAVGGAPVGETIVVPAGDYVLMSNFTVPRDMTIRGAGARTTTIRRHIEFPGRVLAIDSLASVNLSGVRVTGGRAPSDPGGGILVEANGELHLADSAVEDNVADRGGGIFSSGTLEIVRSTIARNQAVGDESQAFGGGIYVGGGTASLENTTVSRNIARDLVDGTGAGGGIYTTANLDLANVTVADNEAAQGERGAGGGLFQDFGSDPLLRTLATNILIARNVGYNCWGTADHQVQATNSLSDEAVTPDQLGPSCNAPVATNLLVADARLGALANNGGPTDTMALLAGSPGIDAAGAPCPAVDQRGVSRPRGVRCDVGAYEAIPAQPSGPPPPPPDDGDELPDPVPHKNVNALPKSGTVKIKLPGSGKFVELQEGQQIPLGTIVDTRKGRVTIVAAAGDGQTADFYAGLFKLSQTKGKKPITVLTLIEKLSCAKKKANAAAKKKRKRRLWGNGTGRFRTKGKHSAATVVGTKWLVEDRCSSTLTRVARGKVKVRDFVKKKTVLVKAGKRYVARARG